MSSRTLLISDLHLEESRADISRSLFKFLLDNRARCEALYVLGDLFEVWIGDDESTALSQSVAQAFRQFSSSAKLYFMHGNRDFLVGEDYAAQCGATLLPEPSILDFEQHSILLLHGDSLCTDDTDYMQFRQMVRQKQWQAEFLASSLKERRAFAEQARQQSQMANSEKSSRIMDVNQHQVEQQLISSGKSLMIHGHTHRPHSHHFTLLNGQQRIEATRVVLGDWDKSVWFAEVSATGIELKQTALAD